MTVGRHKYRKRAHHPPNDRQQFSRVLRRIGKKLARRHHARALAIADQLIASGGLSPHQTARVLSLVGDSEFKRGAYIDAANVYLQSATQCLSHHRLWARSLLSHVRALIKAVEVDQAVTMARHLMDVTRERRAEYEATIKTANAQLAQDGIVAAPKLPPRMSDVAYKLGQTFLDEGEPTTAVEFFEQAVAASPRGGCRARQALARVSLALDDPGQAYRWAVQSIRIGRFRSKTIASWPLLIAARRKLGGWYISRNLLDGLDSAEPSVRARTVFVIVRELRNSDMRQWREVAQKWLTSEGAQFPIIAAELQKMDLATLKATPVVASVRLTAAQSLLQNASLGLNEWLAAAKECVRSALLAGQSVDSAAIVQSGAAKFGNNYKPKIHHSLALSCARAKRNDLAKPLLRKNVNQLPTNKIGWARSAWALARLEESLGNHSAAASLYDQYSQSTAAALRFKVHAKLRWAVCLIKDGRNGVLAQARPAINSALAGVKNPDTILDFARQLSVSTSGTTNWSTQLYEKGRDLALDQFQHANHPVTALDILFKLTRRQVYDFRASREALGIWDALSSQKRNWLWSASGRFWDYLGLLVEAHLRGGRPTEVDAFAAGWMNDPATPAECKLRVGIPYALVLIQKHRMTDAMAIFEDSVRSNPSNPLTASAWYWKALRAHSLGDTAERDRCATCLRRAQGVDVGQLAEWNLDAKALLLLANLQIGLVDSQATNYTSARLQQARNSILADLSLLQ